MADLILENGENINFSDKFFTSQLITYLGNKRALLKFINVGISFVKHKLDKNKIYALDGFAGSGVVSRLLKYHCHKLDTNDIENYSYIINKCYLANKSETDLDKIKNIIYQLNNLSDSALYAGFITKNYAPSDDNNIKYGERVFYTHDNAVLIDSMKRFIFNKVPKDLIPFVLAPLLIQASIHTNTSGVFKGFHKKNGIGHFGGKGENCLERIKGKIKLDLPIFSEKECNVNIFKDDINQFIKQQNKLYDLAYYDPPYNQHPYGSNYFMLNIISNPKESVSIQNGVSGISTDWYKSAYNKKLEAIQALEDLITNTPAKYILMSYNNEGIIPFDVFKSILEKHGNVSILEQDYNTYRGCRNLNTRNIKVKELLWILEKKD